MSHQNQFSLSLPLSNIVLLLQCIDKLNLRLDLLSQRSDSARILAGRREGLPQMADCVDGRGREGLGDTPEEDWVVGDESRIAADEEEHRSSLLRCETAMSEMSSVRHERAGNSREGQCRRSAVNPRTPVRVEAAGNMLAGRKDANSLFESAFAAWLGREMAPVAIDTRPVLALDERKERPTEFHLIANLSSRGARRFSRETGRDIHDSLATMLAIVLKTLYPPRLQEITSPPIIRSISLHIRSFPGVAYTTTCDPPLYYNADHRAGKSKESVGGTHKAIHFSADYIEKLPEERIQEELLGVILHEMVHCFQYDGAGSVPSGVIEGIADYVRMKGELAPPHWATQRMADRWDAGYATTAYFLDFLCIAVLPDLIPLLNSSLATAQWNDGKLLRDMLGVDVEEVWKGYRVEKKIVVPKSTVKEEIVSPII